MQEFVGMEVLGLEEKEAGWERGGGRRGQNGVGSARAARSCAGRGHNEGSETVAPDWVGRG